MRTNIKKDMGYGWKKYSDGSYWTKRNGSEATGPYEVDVAWESKEDRWGWRVNFDNGNSDYDFGFDTPEEAEKSFDEWYEKYEEEKQDEYDQEPHPSEDDIFIDKGGVAFGYKMEVSPWGGRDNPLQGEPNFIEIERQMDQNQYWPNVWDYNERGDPDHWINVKEEADRQRRELAEAGLDENGDEIEMDEDDIEEEENNDKSRRTSMRKGMSFIEHVESIWEMEPLDEKIDTLIGCGLSEKMAKTYLNMEWLELPREIRAEYADWWAEQEEYDGTIMGNINQ